MIYELNTSLLACLLAGFFSYFILLSQHKKISKSNSLSIIVIFLFIGLSVYLKSRALTLSIILSSVLWFIADKKITGKNLLIPSSIIIVLISVMVFFKWHSTLGRIFIWKISLLHIGDYWLFGKGFNSFHFNYAQWQSEWFRENQNFDSFYFVADCPQYAFNEFLHAWVETGLAGLIVLILITCIIIYKVIHLKRNLAGTATLSSFNILLFATISYPLHSMWVLLLLLVSLSIILWNSKMKFKKALISLILLLIFYLGFRYYKYLQFKSKMNEISFIPITETEEREVLFEKLYETQPANLIFYNYYIQFLIGEKMYDKALSVLQQQQKKFNQYEYNLFCGEILFRQKMYHKAIKFFEEAHFIIPNRFIPCYNLMRLYREIGNNEKANFWALMINKMPVKIPSSSINFIKSEAKKLFN